MPESMKFTDTTNRSIEISKFGNLLSWVASDGLNRIAQISGNARDGYAILYGDSTRPNVIHDVGNGAGDRFPEIKSIAFTSNLPPELPVNPGTDVIVTAKVEAVGVAGQTFHITQVFTWKAGTDSLDAVRSVENKSNGDAFLVAAKSHSALLLAKDFQGSESKAMTRKKSAGISLAIYVKSRGACPEPPPDDCRGVEFSNGSELKENVFLVAKPAPTKTKDFSTNRLVTEVPGGELRDKYVDNGKSVKEWEVTLGRSVNLLLPKDKQYSFTTHYEIQSGKKPSESNRVDEIEEAGGSFSLSNASVATEPENISAPIFGEPGNLNDLKADAKQAWSDKVQELIRTAIKGSGTKHLLDTVPSGSSDVIQWQGNPDRVRTCLQDLTKAMKLCDLNISAGDLGRGLCHEEYLEWRAVKNSDGKIVKVEMTTETQEYWILLARYQPDTLRRLVAKFAGENSVLPKYIYDDDNPSSLSPDKREDGFVKMMLPGNNDRQPPLSPYNNGKKAICFLYKEQNALATAAKLLAVACFPFADRDEKPMDGKDIILNRFDEQFRIHAVESTNSDPAVVGNAARQVLNHKAIGLDNVPGIYILHASHDRLRTPYGKVVPEEWFQFDRGSQVGNQRRFQRLTVAVPDDKGFVLGDLIDAGTGAKIKFGYQIAQLVKVGFYYRVQCKDSGKPITLGNDQCSLLRRAYSDHFPLNDPADADVL